MALGSFLAGRYSSTFGGSAMGMTENGYSLRFSHQFQEVAESDAWGASLIDMVLRGCRCNLTLLGLEAGAAAFPSAYWPNNGTFGTLGIIGRMAIVSSLTSAIVLSSTAGTPAATSPASVTCSRTMITQESVEILYHSKLRTIPLAFHVMPSDAGVLLSTS